MDSNKCSFYNVHYTAQIDLNAKKKKAKFEKKDYGACLDNCPSSCHNIMF